MITSTPTTIAPAVEQIIRQISRVPDTDADLTHHLELHDAGWPRRTSSILASPRSPWSCLSSAPVMRGSR